MGKSDNLRESRKMSNAQLFSLDNRVGKHRRRFPGVTVDYVRTISWPVPPPPADLLDAFPSHRAELVAKQVIDDCLDTAFRSMQMRFLDQFALVFAAKEISLATKESLRYLCPGRFQHLHDPLAGWGIDRGDGKQFSEGVIPKPAPLDCMASRSIPTKVKQSQFDESLLRMKDSFPPNESNTPSASIRERERRYYTVERQSSIGSGRSGYDGGLRRRQREAAIERALEQSLYGNNSGKKKGSNIGTPVDSGPVSRTASRKGSAFGHQPASGVANNNGWTYSEASPAPSPEFRAQRIITESKDVLWKKYNECNADNDDRVTLRELVDFLSQHGSKMKNVDIKGVLDTMGVDNRKGITFTQFCMLVRALLRVNPHFTLEVIPLESDSVCTAQVAEHEQFIEDVMNDHTQSLENLNQQSGTTADSEGSNQKPRMATLNRDLSHRLESSTAKKRNDASDRMKRLEDLQNHRIPGYSSQLIPQFEIKDGKILPPEELEPPRPKSGKRRPGTAKSGGTAKSSGSKGSRGKTKKPPSQVEESPNSLSNSTKIFRASAFAVSAGLVAHGAEGKTVIAPNAKLRDSPLDFRVASASPLEMVATLKSHGKGRARSAGLRTSQSAGTIRSTGSPGARRKRVQKPPAPGLVQQVAARALSAPSLGQDGIPRNNLFYKRPTGYKPDLLAGPGNHSLAVSPGVTLREQKKGQKEQAVTGPPYPESPDQMRKQTFQNLTSTLRFMEEVAKEEETREQMMNRLQQGGTDNQVEGDDTGIAQEQQQTEGQDWFQNVPGKPIIISDQNVKSAPELMGKQPPKSLQSRNSMGWTAVGTSRSNYSDIKTGRRTIDYSVIVAEAAQTEESANVRKLLKDEGLGEVLGSTIAKPVTSTPSRIVAHNVQEGKDVDSRRIRRPPKAHRRGSKDKHLRHLRRSKELGEDRDGFVNKIHSARVRSAQLDLSSGGRNALAKGLGKDGGQVVKFQQMLIS